MPAVRACMIELHETLARPGAWRRSIEHVRRWRHMRHGANRDCRMAWVTAPPVLSTPEIVKCPRPSLDAAKRREARSTFNLRPARKRDPVERCAALSGDLLA
jgi:hypothetical protein